MKHALKMLSLTIGLSAACASAAAQGATAFSGSWFVNPGKLEVHGPTFTFTPDAEGFSIRYSDGMGPKQVCDGVAKPTRPGYTRTCTKTQGGYEVTTFHEKEMASQNQWTVTPDGKTLHEKRTYVNADKSTDTREVTATRLGAGTGIAGEWRVTAFTDTAFSKPFVLTGDATSLSVLRPNAEKPNVYKLDGTDVTLSQTAKANMRLDAPQVLHERVSRDGKVVRESVLKLSADGLTMTEVETHPDSPDDRTVTVYEKR